MKYEIKKKEKNKLTFNDLQIGEYFKYFDGELIRLKIKSDEEFVFDCDLFYICDSDKNSQIIKLKPIEIENDIMIFEEV